MMREDIKKVLCDLQDKAASDIRKLLEAKPDFSPTEWKAAGDAVDVIKDVEATIKDAVTTMAMEDEYGEGWDNNYSDMGESKRGPSMTYRKPMTDYYPMGDMNYGRRPRMRGSYAGSSYAGENDKTISTLRNLMNNAATDSERMMYQRFIEEAQNDWSMR